MNLWILRLINMIINVASPELREGLVEFLNGLEEKAKQTANPWDDMLVSLLKSLLLGL